jgi:methionyl-tRNA formyltransferase
MRSTGSRRSERSARSRYCVRQVRLAVAATAPLGADVLQRLAEQHEIEFLLTRPDAPRGRGRKLAPPPAKEAALALGIPVLQPDSPELPDEPVETIVVCAYGLYIPPALLERGLWLNGHPSLLPRWRGAAPVERAILAGDEQSGVTIHRTVEALDAGPIAAQAAFSIGPADDAGALFARAADVAVRLLEEVLPTPAFTPQTEVGATYADKITPAERELDLVDPVDAWRRVRALSPHIGAWATFAGRRTIVWRARLDDGVFRPVEVQPEGKRRMGYEEFLRGVR